MTDSYTFKLNNALGPNVKWVRYEVSAYPNPDTRKETLHKATLFTKTMTYDHTGAEIYAEIPFMAERSTAQEAKDEAARIATPWLRENGYLFSGGWNKFELLLGVDPTAEKCRSTDATWSRTEYSEMSWSALPVEVALEIIEYVCPEVAGGQIGEAAAWTKLWQPEEKNNIDEEQANVNPSEGDDSKSASGLPRALTTDPWSALRSFALTNKYTYELCIPFAYRDFVFTSDGWTPTDETIEKWGKHASSVRNVRILADPEHAPFQYTEFLHGALARFTNVTSLAFYYRFASFFPIEMAERCLEILNTGKVRQFGIYSATVLQREIGSRNWDYDLAWKAYSMIKQYANNTAAADNLRVLDLVLETMLPDTYNIVRTQFPNLRTMNIRRGFRCSMLGRIWDANQVAYWRQNDNLTCLRLIDCSNAYAFHIPHLVRHFKSLRELMVSTCGTSSDDIIGVPRNGGWSTKLDALCNTHAPLDVFHVEHMSDWEIFALGVIPTKVLITTLLPQGHLEAAFTCDPEIFPGLRSLRVENHVDLDETIYGWPTMANAPRTIKTLNAICAGRDIQIERGAKWVRKGDIKKNIQAYPTVM